MKTLKEYIDDVLTLNEEFIKMNNEFQEILTNKVMNGITDENRDEVTRGIIDLDNRVRLSGELIKVVEKFIPA